MGRMLTISALVIILTGICNYQLQAQANSTTKVWINSGSSETDPVYFYQLRDTLLVFSKTPLTESFNLIRYPVTDVYTLELRRRGSIGTGILLGATAGFLVNGIIDLMRQRHTQSACGVCPLLSELESRRGPNRQRYIGSVLAGGVIGGLIGGIKVKISIGGKADRYQYHRKQLEKHLPYR